jgi:hypothetical protein
MVRDQEINEVIIQSINQAIQTTSTMHIDNHKRDLLDEIAKHHTDAARYVKSIINEPENLYNRTIINNILRSNRNMKETIILDWVLANDITKLTKEIVGILCE